MEFCSEVEYSIDQLHVNRVPLTVCAVSSARLFAPAGAVSKILLEIHHA